ncbi:MAG: hypothetical protein QXO27_03915 [Candidatus Aenigmatarchaeota archaeon]
MKKGIVFTTDMIVGLGMAIVIFLVFVSFEFESIVPQRKYEKLNYYADDISNLLSYLQVKSIENKTTVKKLIEDGILNEEDLNKTVLDLIGSFWYADNKTIAENISRELLENITKSICVNVSTDSSTIYSSCNTSSQNVASRSRLASGYEVGKPISGYVARAWATKTKKNTTMIIPFPPEGSGWTAQKLSVTKDFSLSSNIVILNATLYVSIHFGTSKSQAEFQQLKVNGIQKKNDITWLYLQESGTGSEITTAAFGYVDVTNELVTGNNTVYIEIGTPKYHSHIHPGTRLVITYSLNESLGESETNITKRYYFDDVVGDTGAWATLSFFLPPEAKNAKGILHLKAKNVDDTRWFGFNATDVMIYLNDSLIYSDGVTSNCYFISNYYCQRTMGGVMNPEYTFNITNKLVNGTNVVSVYLNSYGDIHWGDKNAQLYSSPLNDPNGSSYVEVSYTLDKPLLGYGEISVTKETLFGGNESNPKTFSFNISDKIKNIIESFTHIAQGFSSMIEVYAWNDSTPMNLIFRSPSIRAIPSTVYIYPSVWSVGENHIMMRDFQPGNSTSDTNYILPWSSFEYSYKIKAMVGYGNVFNSSDLAVEDARQRLVDQIGEDATVSDLVVENKTIQGMKWLWGPTLFKIITWEK